MRFVLTPVFGALVKFVMVSKLSLWVRSVPPAVLLLLAMMTAIPLVCGLTFSVSRENVGCASPGMQPCPLWARPDLVRCDAFDVDGFCGP